MNRSAHMRTHAASTTSSARSTRRAIARPTVIGLVIALVMVALVIGWAIRGVIETETPPRIADAVQIEGPAPLTADERADAVTGLDAQTMVHLESGAWVEVADPETGRLAQRFSARRVEPLPDQWMRMERPRASFHTSGGRVVTLRGDDATVRMPRRAIESGRVEGSVVVHLYRPGPDGRVDPQRDTPVVEILADEAEYDSGIEQLRCEGRVEVRTTAARFVGRGLTLLMESGTRRAEELTVDEALEPVTIDLVALREQNQPAPAEGPSSTTPPTETAGATATTPVDPTGPTGPTGSTPLAAPATPVVPATPGGPDGVRVAAPYRLTLHDDVVVRRFRNGVESTVTGDALALVFSLGEEGPGRELFGAARPPATGRASAFGPAPIGPIPPIDPIGALLLMPFAAVDEPRSESDRLEITYTGRLVMVQSADPEDALLSADETIIEVRGAPVRFEEPDSEIRGRCAMLRYRTANGRLDLVGEPTRPGRPGLLVESSQGDLEGDRLWIVRDRGEGRIEGAGRMTLRDQTPAAAPLAFAWDADGTEASALAMLATVAAHLAERVACDDGLPMGGESLEILWRDGVDLAFEPGSDGAESGGLREAHFRGDVRVTGDEFAMRSDAMRVEFGAAGAADDTTGSAIRAIEATGGVDVDRLGAGGTMTCRTLLVTMQTHEGRAVPHVMTATDDVVARDDEQTIWSDRVEVTFRPRERPATDPDNAAEETIETTDSAGGGDASGGGERRDSMGGAEVHTVKADGNVRVHMRDGSRVFADHLDGDAIDRRIRLTGDDVMLLRDRIVADRMTSVRFDENARTAHADGPGRFRMLAAPSVETDSEDQPQSEAQPAIDPAVELAPEGLQRPDFDDARTELEANWTRAMTIDERTNDGAGSVDLRGDVHVVAEPDPTRRDTLRSESLLLEMRHRESTELTPASADDPGALARTRDLARMIARTEADLQSRRWTRDDRGDTPRLFRVRGQHIEHDAVTGESLVVGNGQLLVHDPTPATEPESTGFGRRGTAIFGWRQRMEMRRIVDERFLITMEDAVEVLHEGVAPGDELTLTTDRLEATIDRGTRRGEPTVLAGPAGPAGPAETIARPRDPFGLGGASELLRLRATGVTFVGTPEYRVDCHEFDYDTVAGLARISARPGRLVRALVVRSAAPLSAREMMWDLRLGRLQITQGGGGAMR